MTLVLLASLAQAQEAPPTPPAPPTAHELLCAELRLDNPNPSKVRLAVDDGADIHDGCLVGYRSSGRNPGGVIFGTIMTVATGGLWLLTGLIDEDIPFGPPAGSTAVYRDPVELALDTRDGDVVEALLRGEQLPIMDTRFDAAIGAGDLGLGELIAPYSADRPVSKIPDSLGTSHRIRRLLDLNPRFVDRPDQAIVYWGPNFARNPALIHDLVAAGLPVESLDETAAMPLRSLELRGLEVFAELGVPLYVHGIDERWITHHQTRKQALELGVDLTHASANWYALDDALARNPKVIGELHDAGAPTAFWNDAFGQMVALRAWPAAEALAAIGAERTVEVRIEVLMTDPTLRAKLVELDADLSERRHGVDWEDWTEAVLDDPELQEFLVVTGVSVCGAVPYAVELDRTAELYALPIAGCLGGLDEAIAAGDSTLAAALLEGQVLSGFDVDNTLELTIPADDPVMVELVLSHCDPTDDWHMEIAAKKALQEGAWNFVAIVVPKVSMRWELESALDRIVAEAPDEVWVVAVQQGVDDDDFIQAAVAQGYATRAAEAGLDPGDVLLEVIRTGVGTDQAAHVIAAGVDVHGRGKHLLSMACASQRWDVAATLLQAGADADKALLKRVAAGPEAPADVVDQLVERAAPGKLTLLTLRRTARKAGWSEDRAEAWR